MRCLLSVSVLFFLCLAGCGGQPVVEEKVKTEIQSKSNEKKTAEKKSQVGEKTKETLTVHLKTDKEIRFDDQIFKDIDSFEEYFLKKNVAGDATLEFIYADDPKYRHTMKSSTVAKARKQRKAVAWVEKNEGSVRYDYEYGAKGKWVKDAQPPGPDWLRQWIGIDYFSGVASITLVVRTRHKEKGPLSTIRDISRLKELKELNWLNLCDTQVSDLAPLEGLTNMKGLYLSATQVHDLTPIKNMTLLKKLRCDRTKITNLSPLKNLRKLEALELMDTQVSDLSSIEGLSELRVLNLGNTQVGNISPLEGLIKLKSLKLYNTQISDLSPLKGLTNLEDLGLSYTKVNNLSGLERLTSLEGLILDGSPVRDLSLLKGLTKLEYLSLENTQVTKEEVQKLQAALPNCEIDWDNK